MATVLRMGTATAVFVSVAAAGHIMNSRAAPPAAAGHEVASIGLTVTDVRPTLGTFEERARREPAARLAQVQDCAVDMSASRRAAGLALLAVRAPCRAGERMTIQHDALAFTLALGPEGRAEIEVPALAVDAVFFAFFDDAAGAMAEIRMPEVASLDRAGLMWQGEGALGLHASEYGAAFGEEGYVWTGAPRSASRAMLGEGGFLTRLGDGLGEAPQIAEIYTFPSGSAPAEGAGGVAVEIALEAAYDAATCGRDLTATAFRAGQDGVSLVPVTLPLPDCDTAAEGGFVQLNGMLEPITLAAGD